MSPFKVSGLSAKAPNMPVSSSLVIRASSGPCLMSFDSNTAIIAATPKPSSAPKVVPFARTQSPCIVDPDSFRIMASSRVEKYLSTERPPYAPDDEVELLVWQHTNMGYKVIIDNKYQGLVFENQVFRELEIGDRLKGFITQVREDGKVDVALQRSGRQQTLDFADTLLKYMERNGGRCYLHDKSPAEEIYDRFKVSKKVFKKAVGDLYKRRLIEISDHGLELIN